MRRRALRQHLEDRGGDRSPADISAPRRPGDRYALRRLRFAGSGFQLAHGGGRLDSMAPELSAHTDRSAGSLGYDANAIADLRAREIV